MLKLKLYLSASAFAAATLDKSDKEVADAALPKFQSEKLDARDFDYWADRVRELRGKFQNLATHLTESEIIDANKAAADKLAKK